MSISDTLSAVHNNTEMADALAALRQEFAQARNANSLDEATEASVQSCLIQAIREVNMPVPSKMTILDHLDSAQEALSNHAAVAPLVEALKLASTTVQRLF